MKTLLGSVLMLGTIWVGQVAADELTIFPAVELEFTTVAGGIYQLQSSSNLIEWVDCEGPITGDGNPVCRLCSIRGTNHRFFRLLSDLPPTGALTNYSDCTLPSPELLLTGSSPSPSEECLQVEYDGQGTLTLKHINAGFNCCPDGLLGDVVIEGNSITITETELGGLCNCNCLHDLEYEIANLDPDTYTIQVVPTAYVPPHDPPLVAVFDLTHATNGLACVRRSGYPWDPPLPAGQLVSHSECLSLAAGELATALTADPPSTSEGCLLYEYEANTAVLRFTHFNAGFNCCPGELFGEVTIVEGQIQIAESEAAGLCLCLCLYQLDFEIRNLLPGTYTVDASEPYLDPRDPKLTVTLDLVTNPTGRVCFPRTVYPWGF